jgi:2-dehydropantoate 2-reductase
MIGRESRIAVVGAGAVGGITAALLKRGGYDVEVVCKYPDLAQKIRTEGLHVTGVRGDFRMPLPAVAEIEGLLGEKDLVFLATKATAMLAAAARLKPLLGRDTLVVSLQNGICEPALAEVLGAGRVVGCVVGWGATMHAPGELEMTSEGEFVIGNIEGKPDGRLAPLAGIMGSVLPTHIAENIFSALYSKLIVNSCITSLGAVCGLTMGEMLASQKARSLFIAVMNEAVAVADAKGLRIAPYAGKLDYYAFTRGRGWLHDLRRHLVIRAIGFKYRRLTSSSLQSLQRRQQTEIDYFNGYICRLGRETGIATPVNDRIVAMIHEIEAGRREITVENFRDPLFERR